EGRPGATLPSVVIAITKADECLGRLINPGEIEEILDEIKKLVGTVFHREWLTMICPLTLGRSLSENVMTGEIDPVNLHIPVLFAIYYHFTALLPSKQIDSDDTNAKKVALEKSWSRWLGQVATLGFWEPYASEISVLQGAYSLLNEEIARLNKDVDL